jgi:SAM-dependent methyltransferase
MQSDFDEVAMLAFERNRRRWDALAPLHREDATGFYGVERFLAGGDTLTPIVARELGDVRGLRIAHLQCHFGMDSISLARRGADVAGLDFSAAAIAEAKKLAIRTGFEIEFVLGNVYEAREKLTGLFDRVFTSWGTVVWLPDMPRWARVVASLLKPGGWLYFADGHPMLLCHDADGQRLVLTEDWQTPVDKPLIYSAGGSYTGDATGVMESHEWIHSVGTMVNALIGAGLDIAWVKEHDGLPWQQISIMARGADGLFHLPAGCKQLPLALSIKAVRRAETVAIPAPEAAPAEPAA